MFCKICEKLAVIVGNERKCIRCNGIISNNISCICENCSKEQALCSVCLKKLASLPPPVKQNGCGCGQRNKV